MNSNHYFSNIAAPKVIPAQIIRKGWGYSIDNLIITKVTKLYPIALPTGFLFKRNYIFFGENNAWIRMMIYLI